jgi:hypothetical protein
MGLIDLIGIGLSSIVMVVLSKTRLHCKNNCYSCSYNEHNIDLGTSNDESKNENDDEHIDIIESYKTLPPPIYDPLKHQTPLGVQNLKTLQK